MTIVVARVIVRALLHSLWLTTAAALLYAALRPRLAADLRHRLGGLLLAASPLGAALVALTGGGAAGASGGLAGNRSLALGAAAARALGGVAPGAPAPALELVVAGLWGLGCGLIASRPLLGLWVLHRVRRGPALPAPWAARARRLAADLGPRLRFVVVERAEVPFAFGWLFPVVAIPASLLTRLPPEIVELLIEHELTHLRRHDALVQWLQRFAEALLFFHPLAWWLSHQVTLERELACDAEVVARGADRLRYARALTELETLRHAGHALALGAKTSQPGALMQRIQHILAPPPPRRSGAALAGALSVVAAVGALAMACVDDVESPIEGPTASQAAPLTVAWLPSTVTRHRALLEQTAAEVGVDADVLALMVLVESGGEPKAVSPTGARGLLQLMPSTAARIAERHRLQLAGEDALFDPALNLKLGALHLADLLAEHRGADDPLARAWASYNAGADALRRHLEQGADLPEETQRYVALLGALFAERGASESPAYLAWRRRLGAP
ncbi:MAG: M56 family metallopeptidase [Polyangiaceae bacterium]